MRLRQLLLRQAWLRQVLPRQVLLRQILFVLLAAVTLAACARSPHPQVASRADIDVLMYGNPTPVRGAQVAQAPQRGSLDVMMYGTPAPASRTVTRVTEVVPVRMAALPQDNGPYTLDSGDKLRIVVFGQDTLSNTYAVDANGQVSMPLIGVVDARGLTTTQLAAAIASRLKASFIRDPSVAVEIETYRPFFVLGEVSYPGQYPYVPHMTVEKAIAIAGGFTPRASRQTVTVTRKIQGYPLKIALPLGELVKPGDTITVSERWF